MNRREFHFQEGNSRKFWAIELEGPRFTVQFGRIGTAGQTQTKEFADDAAARTAADKLIAEKTKKGYIEVGAGAAPAAAPAPAKKKPAAAPPTSAPAPAPAVAAATVSRRIDLDPRDWLWATWRPRQPLPKPTPPPFDLKKALDRFLAVAKAQAGWWNWYKLRLETPLSREEAHFWFVVVSRCRDGGPPPEKRAAMLANEVFDGRVSLSDAAEGLKGTEPGFSRQFEQAGQILPFLLAPADLITVIADRLYPDDASWLGSELAEGFVAHALPYLSNAEIADLQRLLRKHMDPKARRSGPVADTDAEYYLTAALGMHDEVKRVVSAWPDAEFQGRPWVKYHQWLVFGLGDAHEVDRQTRRLKLSLPTPEIARAWLAHTEMAGLDLLRDAIRSAQNKQAAADLFYVLRLVHSPEAAPHMLDLKINSKVQGLAGAWLDENPGDAVAGLIPVAADKGKLAEAAVEYLRAAKKKGHAEFIESQLKTAPAETAAKVRALVLEHEEKVYEVLDEKSAPKPLRDALAATAPESKLSGWSAPALLPPILVGGRRLADEQTSAVLGALRRTPLDSKEPLLDSLKEHGDPASLDAFAWRLFEQWLSEGAPSKEKWAFLALGRFGGDASVLKLTPLVRAWPGESQHARAVLGLECLRAVGSDTALMQLNGIAQKLKFQGLKNKAKEFMEAIAKDKGLSREELEDRIVPDLDLDERGGRDFDFGPRRFRLVLGPDLAPMVRDEAGKVKSDLPKPGAKDDPEKAAAAVEAWKLVKKQLREVLKVQAPRLEQAMVTGRRWPVGQFETLLVRHPLMTNLARRLLWAGYDAKGKVASLFRVTEEREYADADDKPLSLKGVATVGVVHPLNLTEAQRSAWGQVFGDYEIIPPFPQLGRPVFTLDSDEAKAKTITRLANLKLPPMSVRGTLDRLGWTRGSCSDHGVIQEFFKHFPAADATALLEVEPGIPIGNPDWSEEQKAPRVFFLAGSYNSVDYPYHKEETFRPLNKVDAVAVSEVLADLAALAPKGA